MGEPSDKRRVANAVATEIKQAFGERVHEVRLYGSVATGSSDDDSDIDLLLVVDRKTELEDLSRLLGERMAASGEVIHLVTVTPEELDALQARETPRGLGHRRYELLIIACSGSVLGTHPTAVPEGPLKGCPATATAAPSPPA